MFVNLLGNALKFTSRGEVKLTVSMPNRTSSQATLEFVVQDTGIGIPVDKQDAVFEVFTQADGSMSRNYGGTGLGLAICSRLVEKMGGGGSGWKVSPAREVHFISRAASRCSNLPLRLLADSPKRNLTSGEFR